MTWATAPAWLKLGAAYLGIATILPFIQGTLGGIAELIAAVGVILMAFSIRRLCKAWASYLRDMAWAARVKAGRPDQDNRFVLLPQAAPPIPQSTATLPSPTDRGQPRLVDATPTTPPRPAMEHRADAKFPAPPQEANDAFVKRRLPFGGGKSAALSPEPTTTCAPGTGYVVRKTWRG